MTTRASQKSLDEEEGKLDKLYDSVKAKKDEKSAGLIELRSDLHRAAREAIMKKILFSFLIATSSLFAAPQAVVFDWGNVIAFDDRSL